MWVEISSEELVPGDVVSLKAPAPKKPRKKRSKLTLFSSFLKKIDILVFVAGTFCSAIASESQSPSSSFSSCAGRRRLEDSEESDPLPAVVPCDAILLRGAYVLHLYFCLSVCVHFCTCMFVYCSTHS